MALQHILKNSAVSGKEPTASQLANGEIALNYHVDGPFLTCKDTSGAIRRITGVWISATSPSTPTPGEFWLDLSVTPAQLKIYKDTTDTWIQTYTVAIASTTVSGIVELATDAETITGADALRAVTPASLQAKLSDSTGLANSARIASSTAVKSAYDLADAALPRTGGTITGAVQFALGAAATPSITFTGDTNTGLFSPSADQLSVTTGGTERLRIDAAGQIEAVSLGTAAAPAWSFVSDPNTGLYSPGADLLALSTAGAERLRIDSSGRLLVGTSTTRSVGSVTPAFQVEGTSFNTASMHLAINANDTQPSYLTFAKTRGTALGQNTIVQSGDNLGIIRFYGADGTTLVHGASIVALVDGTPGVNDMPGRLVFSTTADGASTPTERLRIDSAGRVGIGTTSPATQLHVLGTGTQTFRISNTSLGSNASPELTQIVFTGFNDTVKASVEAEDKSLNFTGGWLNLKTTDSSGVLQTALHIDREQRVGIGTSSPAARLHVFGGAEGLRVETSASSEGYIRFVNTSGSMSIGMSGSVGNNLLIYDRTNNQAVYAYAGGASGYHGWSTNNIERLRIDSAGRVGIGTSSPSLGLLEVSSTNGVTLAIKNTSGTAVGNEFCQLTFNNTSNSATNFESAKIKAISTNGGSNLAHLTFENSGTERLRIDSSGNVGIGTTTAGARLQVNAPTTSRVYTSSVLDFSNIHLEGITASTTTSALTFSSGNGGGAAVAFSRDNAFGTFIGFWTNSAASANAATERLRIDNSGNVGIGTSSPGELLHLSANTDPKIQFTDVGNVISKIGISASTALTFEHNGSERLRIDSSGRVGIGTSSPASLFHLNASASGGGAIFANQGYNCATVSQVISSADAIFGGGVIASDVGQEVKKINADAAHYIKIQTGEGISFHTNITGASGTSVNRGTNERLRIDSSGRLLVGTSTARANFYNTTATAQIQVEGVGAESASFAAINVAGNAGGARLYMAKGRGGAIGSNTIVSSGDVLGQITFQGNDGSEFVEGATIEAQVDGTPGVNDMPGRLVFSTTADGSSSPTEQLRISNGGTVLYNQPAPAAVDVTATLTVANLTAKIITSSTAAAVTMTLPTGTLMDGGFSGLYNNMAFKWSVINTGATNAVTVQGGASHTLVGSGTVATNNSVRFSSRRTGTTTWVTYRVG